VPRCQHQLAVPGLHNVVGSSMMAGEKDHTREEVR
jgi:hypothetical protein